LRHIEDADERALRLAKHAAEDILTDLTGEHIDGIRRRVRASIEGIEAGKYLKSTNEAKG
jgi:hypothetical protein